MQESLDAISHANELFRLLVARYGEKRQPNTLGLTSRSLYDTAWVSLVSRRYNSRIEWVFPNAFDRVCEAQRDDGGWDAASGEPVDSIIVTLACLLSLKRHQGAAWSRALAGKIFRKATKAIAWLNTSLESEWDVDSTHRRAFELTVPNLLDLLVKEAASFVWPYQRCLYALRDETLSKMEDATLYSPYNPYPHCLEVLIDTLDFDRITSLGLGKGGFGHSSSFAAAYLMKASKWDKDMEAYLQQALHSCGDGSPTR